MLILGLNGGFVSEEESLVPHPPPWFYHDAAACIIKDGEVVAAVEEERLTRLKHTNRFPTEAISWCLQQSGTRLSDVEAIAFFYGEDYTDTELGLQFIQDQSKPARRTRELIVELLHRTFGHEFPPQRVHFIPHHIAHGSATFVNSAYDDALVAVFDGNGEEEAISIYSATNGCLSLLHTTPYSASLGHLYSETTRTLGYKFFDEYKVMGLAPYGDPTVYEHVFKELCEMSSDGRYSLDVRRVQRSILQAGYQPRLRGAPFSQRDSDLAAALQSCLEDVAVHVLSHWANETGHRRLALAGGVAHNCSMNGRLAREAIFDEIFVDGASHDAGSALGAAYAVESRTTQVLPRRSGGQLTTMFLGPPIEPEAQVAGLLSSWSDLVSYERVDSPARTAAGRIARGEVVAWVQGRSEFGPRALGNRSILADPRPADNKARINAMVKQREGYRPFAPAVTAESAQTYFDIPESATNLGFMSFAVGVRPEWQESLGAVTHVDGSARLQVVKQQDNPLFWDIIQEFSEISGIPVLLNTSFNNHAEPIVQSAQDAVVAFLTTGLDALVIGNMLVRRIGDTRERIDGLVVSLPSTCELSGTSAGSGRTRYQLRHEAAGAVREITADTWSMLTLADNARTVGELLREARPEPSNTRNVVSELFELWQDRFISMRPAD